MSVKPAESWDQDDLDWIPSLLLPDTLQRTGAFSIPIIPEDSDSTQRKRYVLCNQLAVKGTYAAKISPIPTLPERSIDEKNR